MFQPKTGEYAEHRTAAAVEYLAQARDIPSTLTCGTKTVAATPEPLVAQSTPCKAVVIMAPCDANGVPTNAKPAFVGSADAQVIQIDPDNAEGIKLEIDDASKLTVRVGVNGEGVNYAVTI